ncbi:MAG: sigma-70 family RNA polymerase sigma factor [Pirellulaceae bacterium]|nr:sigma-70 family RNA polymerase sigma factor [Pirellulaceae bacterium]
MKSPAPIESPLPQLLERLRAGDDRAVSVLWEQYFRRMLFVARKKLGGAQRRVRDEEDIALSAFKSFCLGFKKGRFASADEDCDLWPLLVTITINKAIDHLRRENRQKRSSENEVAAGPLDVPVDVLSSESAPELQLITDESFEKLLAALDATGDLDLKRLALLKLENHPATELAAELGCTVRTVQRKLKTIREIWQANEV